MKNTLLFTIYLFIVKLEYNNIIILIIKNGKLFILFYYLIMHLFVQQNIWIIAYDIPL